MIRESRTGRIYNKRSRSDAVDILFVTDNIEALEDDCGPLMQTLKGQGLDVAVLCMRCDHAAVGGLGALAVEWRGTLDGTGPLRRLMSLTDLIRRVAPSSVFAHSIGSALWGTLAARLAGVSDVYCLINGMQRDADTASAAGRHVGALERLRYGVIGGLSRLAIFQRLDDLKAFQTSRLFRRYATAHLAQGSGVDLQRFSFSSVPDGASTFLCLASASGRAGVRAFLSAAAAMSGTFPAARFQVLGMPGQLERLMDAEALASCRQSGVEVHADSGDVRPWIAQSSVVVLPARGEAANRAMLQAMGCGRAIVAGEDPHDRVPVVNGINGLLVSPGDAEGVERAMRELLRCPQRISAMGKMSRHIVEARHDVGTINADILSAMAACAEPEREAYAGKHALRRST